MDNPLCFTFRRRLTPSTLRWTTLSSPAAERGFGKHFVMLNGMKHLLLNFLIVE